MIVDAGIGDSHFSPTIESWVDCTQLLFLHYSNVAWFPCYGGSSA
jgi:hypothetical protein